MGLPGVMNTALSGMQAQANRLSAVANNIANSDTPGYSRLNTNLSALPGTDGVSAIVSANTGEPVDPATEMLDMMDAEMSFKANLAAFETGASLWDALLGIKKD